MGVVELSRPADRSLLRLRGLTLPELWATLAVLLPVVAALAAPLSTVDLAYAIRAGQLMLDGGSVLRADPFTFTAPGTAWLDQQWAAQIVFAIVYGLGGWVLLAVARAALVGLIFAFVLAAARRYGFGLAGAGRIALLAFLLAAPSLAMRAQLLGMLCFAIAIWVVSGAPSRRRARILPFVALVWANVHGSFVLCPALAAYAVARDVAARRPMSSDLLVLALTTGATLVTPFGPAAWGYALGLALDQRIRSLFVEWQPPSPVDPFGLFFFGSVVVVAVALGVASRRAGWRTVGRAWWPEVLMAGALAVLGIAAVRGIAWWAMGGPLFAAAAIRRQWTQEVRAGPDRVDGGGHLQVGQADGRAVTNALLAGLVALAGVAAFPLWRSTDPGLGLLPLITDAPAPASSAVTRLVPQGAHLLVPQRWASWFELTAVDRPVMVDSRAEVVPADAWSDYLSAVSGDDVGPILARWNVQAVVVDRATQGELSRWLSASSGWHLAFEDAASEVFVRS